MSHVAESTAQSLIDSLIAAIKDQLKYVWSYGTYIKDLKDVLTNLEDARERRQEEVDRANRNAEDIYVGVTKWLEDVNKITEEAAKVLEKHENSKKGCCRGVIPNPSTRFLIAKDAEANKQEIEKLQQRNNFQSVSHPQVPVGIVTGNYMGPEYWMASSRASLLVDISKALLDAKVRMVGIWGAPGAGKSILLKQLEKQVKKNELNYDFDAVTAAVVSRSPNWNMVQDDLAYRLGLTLKEENTVDQKAIRLRERLRQKGKILLILDDIWEKIDLEKLGIPFDDTHANIKILLTSRSEQVLKSQMASQQIFHLDSLEEYEAVELFKRIVGDRAGNESTLIDQLAKKCIGLPILISLLATYIKFLPSTDWVEALKTFHNQTKENFIEEVFKSNYHLMKSEEAKLLFLLCIRIGRQIISTEDLVLYGMGMGFLEGVHTIDAASKKVELHLKNLEDSRLLDEHRESFVKIHDLISDAALSIASKTHPSLVIRDSNLLKECSHDGFSECRSITLYHNDKMRELPERLICPKLEMLLIYSEEYRPTHLEVPDEFFKDLGELKVLDISDMIMTSLPSTIQFLGKLHTLCLDRVSVEDVAIIGKLKTLRCLTLRKSKISRLPKEIGELINLRLLNLAHCHSLRVIEPNVLGNLIHMEELLLPTSFDNWDAEGTSNASLTELNNMSSLTSLTICVPNAATVPIDMRVHQLVCFVIQIGNRWGCGDGFTKAKTLKLEFDSNNGRLIWKEWVQTTLKKTRDFYLHGWIGFEESITELSEEGFPKLRHIHVENCPSVQYIIHSKQPNAVPVLETLFLFGLTNLRKLCQCDHPHNYFKNLKVIKIEACDELTNLFSSSLVKSLPNLEEINVSDCMMIQEIITYTEMDTIVDKQDGNPNDKYELVELKRLHKLELANLRNISSFCGKNKEIIEDDGSSQFSFFDRFQVSFPCLKSLTLRELPKLRAISHNQHPVQLHHLKSLKLCKCESLLYAIDANLLLQLKNLESLTIDSCESMETIFNLEDLDACVCIFNQPLQIKLQKVEVSNCHKLKNLFSSSMVKFIENISHISVVSCVVMEEIVWEDRDNVQELQDGWVFPSLTHLSISNMENLKTFSYGQYYYQFPSLIEMMISSCPKMRTFVFAKHAKDETTMSEDIARDASFFNNKVALPSLEKLILRSLDSMISIWNNYPSEGSFFKLASIDIEKCARVLSIFPPHLLERLQNLTKVKVESCGLLEVLFGNGHRKSIQCKLEELRLLDLPKLRYLVMKSHSLENANLSFSSLRDVFVKNCHSLIHLFPNAIAQNLSELVNMHIVSCEGLKEVVSFDVEEDDSALTEAMRFKKLTSLQLENLCSLVHFCSGHYELEFLFLKKLTIIGCKELKAFVLRPSGLVGPKEQSQDTSSINNVEVDGSPLFDEKVIFPSLQELKISSLVLKEIWPKSEPTSFQMDLKVFSVEGCHQLSTIFPSRMSANWNHLESLTIKSCNSVEVIFRLERHISKRHKLSSSKSTTKVLQHLRELTISSCEAMQCIVAMGDDDYIGETYYKTIIFSQLSSLKLSKLPRLGSFCPINHEIRLPSLEKIEVEDCEAVEVLFADSNQHCKPLFLVEKVEFPRMESMVIRNMQKLRDLWHISNEGTHLECSSEAFCKLKSLEVEKCDGILTIFPSEMIRAFFSLKSLSVSKCESVKSIFEYPELMSRPESGKLDDVVPMVFALGDLHLRSLPQMKHVWNVVDPRWVCLSFGKLYHIFVENCGSLRHLFPASIARCLPQLSKLDVLNCTEMEGIVWTNEESADGQLLSMPSLQSLGMHPLEWPSLEVLNLLKCPRLKLFASIQQKVNIPRLKMMITDASTLENSRFLDEIDEANLTQLGLQYIENKEWVESIPWLLLVEQFPKLRTLGLVESNSKEIFPPSEGVIVPYKPGILDFVKRLDIFKCHQLTIVPLPLALFHNITELNVQECDGLQYLVTLSVARGLVQLTKLMINGCKNLEQIVTHDYDENGNIAKDGDADISFPRLNDIHLHELPRLRSFSSTSCKFNFPSLKAVCLKNLPKMHVFCEGGFNTPYKHRITRALYNREVK